MNTWAGPHHNCTDCGKPMDRPGTCSDCMVTNQPVPSRLKRDLNRRGTDRKGKRK